MNEHAVTVNCYAIFFMHTSSRTRHQWGSVNLGIPDFLQQIQQVSF